MRIESPQDILNIGKEVAEPLGLGGAGADEFLTRVNFTISNLKELLKMFMQFKELNPQGAKGAAVESKPQISGLAQAIQLVKQAGYGDTKIEKLIKEISPFTINQIEEYIKNAGLTR